MDYPLALSLGLCAVVSFLYFLSHHKFAGLLVFYLTTILGVLTHLATAIIWPFCLYLCWYKGYNLKASLKSLLPLALLMIAELVLIVCHEQAPKEVFDAALKMRVWPLGAGLQEQAPNHLELHRSRAGVVSVEENTGRDPVR